MTESDCADEVLMRRFQETMDEGVFRLLASRHYEVALRIAERRVGNHSTAQDAVQEALIRVVRYRRRYHPSRPFAPWFHTILRNVCTDMLRQEARRRDSLQSLAEAAPPMPVSDPRQEKLVELLAGLSGGNAQLLRLRYVCGFSLEELASHCQSSQEAVKKRIQRLIQRLKG
ncbi:MAG: sigma-70 family RNA polymerase sigma factor [Verrucomicrobia bacterium]|nr:sigma-70 family RNA polymerase sigma factor [Verrucomicrobiota bacterium]